MLLDNDLAECSKIGGRIDLPLIENIFVEVDQGRALFDITQLIPVSQDAERCPEDAVSPAIRIE